MLFIDDNDWDSFLKLAATLRRAGLRTIRATTVPPGRAVRAFNILFNHTVVLTSLADTAELDAILAGYTILDVQATETVAEFAYRYASSLGEPHKTARWAGRSELLDKLDIAGRLAAIGVLVPDAVSAAELSADGAAAALGLPVVLKRRIGSGGDGVQIIHSLDELRAAAAAPGAADRFYERHITGAALTYGCVSTRRGATVAITYVRSRWAAALTAAIGVQAVDAPEIDKISEHIVGAVGMQGLLSLQFIRDDNGDCWLHDVNPRIWGTFDASIEMRADIGAAYIAWLRDEPLAELHSQAGHGPVTIFPGALRAPRHEWPGPWTMLRWLWTQQRRFGVGYLAIELVRNRKYFRTRRDGPPTVDIVEEAKAEAA